MTSKAAKYIYPGRELINYEWCPSLEYEARKQRERRVKMVKAAADKLNLPADAFADDVITDDDVGVFYPDATDLGSNWSSLGEHGKTQADF